MLTCLVALWRFNRRDAESTAHGLVVRSYVGTTTVPWESLRCIVSTRYSFWGKLPELASIVVVFQTPEGDRRSLSFCGSTKDERAADMAARLHQGVPEAFRGEVGLIRSTQTLSTLRWSGPEAGQSA